MEKCINLNSATDYEKQNFNGYAFASSDNNLNPIIEFGKHQNGKLKSGIRYFKQSNTLQMGKFNTSKSISLECGFKRFSNGDICISNKFTDVTNVGLIGAGPTLYIYKNGNWCYGKFVRGKVNGSAIFFDANSCKLYYREYAGKSYKNEQEIYYLDYIPSLKIGLFREDGIGMYDLDYTTFQSHYYTNCEVYAMGMRNCEDGLGYAEWTSGDKYIGQWRNGDRDGLGIYYYANKTVYACFNKSKLTEYRFEIFNSGEIDFGYESSAIPRFSFLTSGAFVVQGSGKYALYVNPDFMVSIDEYSTDRNWVQRAKTININNTETQDFL